MRMASPPARPRYYMTTILPLRLGSNTTVDPPRIISCLKGEIEVIKSRIPIIEGHRWLQGSSRTSDVNQKELDGRSKVLEIVISERHARSPELRSGLYMNEAEDEIG